MERRVGIGVLAESATFGINNSGDAFIDIIRVGTGKKYSIAIGDTGQIAIRVNNTIVRTI